MNMHDATEQAYKNGYNDAINRLFNPDNLPKFISNPDHVDMHFVKVFSEVVSSSRRKVYYAITDTGDIVDIDCIVEKQDDGSIKIL